MNPFIKIVSGGILLSLLVSTSQLSANELPNLDGIWSSEGIENYGTVYATRTFVFKDKSWSVAFDAYADSQKKLPLFSLDVGGFYVVGNPSSIVNGASEGIFPANHRNVIAQSNAGVQMFASMGCNLEIGKSTPLVNQGCGFIPGLMQSMGEYDLLSYKNGKLYFGDRSGDLTKSRPNTLTTYPVVKK
ncbi:MAG: hypothetical protein PHW18_13035 [Sulfuricurvum sp.]|uniref:hypothetical protein n=1 Tax=Sulfuricurvum sp. TaxID=2025608 RepID=UPI002629AA5D|nr:hypothetical protein [Sulfuricurvum sp.]MDD2830492.1 hypothetical protein [Sulfuricurvum sp.]MDD4950353.1 hypothetical protein [Sulfuricurvum sp.]